MGNQCVACEPPCVTCEDSVNFCTACETGKVIFEGKCYESCPSGYEVY